MPAALSRRLRERLASRRDAGLSRERHARTGTAAQVAIGPQGLVNFAGNDYLGLAADPRVVAAFRQGADLYGVGAGGAELVCGHTEAHALLENALARFTGRDRALVFSTGYMANLSVVTVLAERGTAVLEDRLNHASLIDAGTLARARLLRYAHRDVPALADLLRRRATGRALVVTDGVFSMDGDIAPLAELADACTGSDALLVVDDAHGFGVLGESGGGALEHHRLSQREAPVLIGTFGKALGCFGAFVAGSAELIDALIQFARPYIFTTALPPALASAVSASLRIVETEPWRRDRLRTLVERFRIRAAKTGVPLASSTTPIQPIVLGDDRGVVEIANRLRDEGFLVGAVRPPSVPAGTARLRITLSVAQSDAQVDALVDLLAPHLHG